MMATAYELERCWIASEIREELHQNGVAVFPADMFGDRESAIYLLSVLDRIVYVGETSSLPQRLRAHRKEKYWTEAHAFCAPSDRRDREHVERKLIRSLHPAYNAAWNVGPLEESYYEAFRAVRELIAGKVGF